MPSLFRRLLCSFAVCAFAAGTFVPSASAAKAIKSDKLNLDPEMETEGVAAKPNKKKDNANAKPAAVNVAENEARALAKLRERLAVEEDDEWAVIAERVTKVETLRRSLAVGPNGPRAGAAAGDKAKRNARPAGSTNPEMDALRAAVGDQYPDAEIKSRLARAHETYLRKEADLRKAQGELRAVLTIRQEAIAVMAGLLPP